jgi:hypothetical protein
MLIKMGIEIARKMEKYFFAQHPLMACNDFLIYKGIHTLIKQILFLTARGVGPRSTDG